MVAAFDSKSNLVRGGGSIPLPGTIKKSPVATGDFLIVIGPQTHVVCEELKAGALCEFSEQSGERQASRGGAEQIFR